MEKTKMKVFEICELKDSLMQWAREHKECRDISAYGQVVDMIKDLADAEKNCWKACYYKSIVEAMHEEKEAMKYGGDRAGYDHWRYSSGRFAPSGRGHYSAGYTPTFDDRGSMDMDWDFKNPRMGYTTDKNSMGGSNTGRGGSRMSGYQRYRNARMGYQSSGSEDDKHEMSEAAKEQIDELSESVHDIWKDADPSTKKELKSHLMSLIGEMS